MIDWERSALRQEGHYMGTGMLLLIVAMQCTFTVVALLLHLLGIVDLRDPSGYMGLGNTGFLLLYAAVYAFCMGVPFVATDAAFRRHTRPFRPAKWPGAVTALLYVAAGLGLCIFANYVANYVLQFLSAFGIRPADSPSYLEGTGISLALNIFVVAVLPALLEEMVFRGYILQALRPFGNGTAMVVSSLLFALMHGNLEQTPFAFIVGMTCSAIVIRTGCIWLSCAVHFLNNLMSVLLDYFTMEFSAHGQQVVLISVFLAVALIGLAAALLQNRRDCAAAAHTAPEPEKRPTCTLSCSAKTGALLSSPPFLLSLLFSLSLILFNTIGGSLG